MNIRIKQLILPISDVLGSLDSFPLVPGIRPGLEKGFLPHCHNVPIVRLWNIMCKRLILPLGVQVDSLADS